VWGRGAGVRTLGPVWGRGACAAAGHSPSFAAPLRPAAAYVSASSSGTAVLGCAGVGRETTQSGVQARSRGRRDGGLQPRCAVPAATAACRPGDGIHTARQPPARLHLTGEAKSQSQPQKRAAAPRPGSRCGALRCCHHTKAQPALLPPHQGPASSGSPAKHESTVSMPPQRPNTNSHTARPALGPPLRYSRDHSASYSRASTS